MVKKAKLTEAERADLIKRVKSFARKGSTLYTTTKSVARSGMSREIAIFAIVGRTFTDANGKRRSQLDLADLSYMAAKLCGYRIGKHGGVAVTGVGMDMHFAVVYEIASAVYGDGYALKKSSI